MASTPPIEVLLARRELALEKRALQLRIENGIDFYCPHEKQYQFHISGDYRFRHARYGNQTGKSEMGSAEDLAFALGYRPWMEKRFPIINGKNETVAWHEGYPGHPYATLGIPSHATNGLIIGADWDKTKEVFTEQEGENKGKMFTYAPISCIGQPTRNHSGAIDRIPIKHKSGTWSIIRFDTVKSYKQNPMGLESSIWDWIHVDEPCPEKMFKAAARGLMRRNGKAWFPLTPLTEPWIEEMFAPDGEKVLDDVDALVADDKIMMTATMYDNPYLSESGRQGYINLLTDDEKDCRVYGHPTAYAGLVFKEFNYTEHVLKDPPPGWKDWETPPTDFCIRYAIDYHFRKNDAVLFIATSPQNVSYVYGELWQQMLIDEEVTRIREFLGQHPSQPGIVDPLASTPNKLTEVTAMDEYRRLGLAVIPATKDPVNGIRSVKSTLKARDKHGKPVIYFNSALRRTLFEISRGFVWDGDENKPVKKNDDMMENLHRLCLQGLDYIEPAGENDYSSLFVPDFDDYALSLPSDPDEDALRKKSRAHRLATRYRSFVPCKTLPGLS